MTIFIQSFTKLEKKPCENIVEKEGKLVSSIFFFSHNDFSFFNPLPDMPILGSSNSAANKDIMSEIWTNGDTIIFLTRKHRGKRRNYSLRPISPFLTMFSKAAYC